MTDENTHTLTFTSSQIAKIHAAVNVGMMILEEPELAGQLINAGRPYSGTILVAMALLAGHGNPRDIIGQNEATYEEAIARAAAEQYKVKEGLKELTELMRPLAKITVLTYAPENAKGRFLAGLDT